jgi:hypothetical protein
VEAEKVQVLDCWKEGTGMPLQQAMKSGGTTLLHSEPQKIRQPAAHTLRLPEGLHPP